MAFVIDELDFEQISRAVDDFFKVLPDLRVLALQLPRAPDKPLFRRADSEALALADNPGVVLSFNAFAGVFDVVGNLVVGKPQVLHEYHQNRGADGFTEADCPATRFKRYPTLGLAFEVRDSFVSLLNHFTVQRVLVLTPWHVLPPFQ
jgi:hypothetical protein